MFSQELLERGFKPVPEVVFDRSILRTMRDAGITPTFCRTKVHKDPVTYVIDERGKTWMRDGNHDLHQDPLGFTETRRKSAH